MSQRMGVWKAAVVAGVLALAPGARAEVDPPGTMPGPRPGGVELEQAADAGFVAVRTGLPPALDGRLDEAEWQQAPVFDRFVQSFPREGAAPSERTEVRVLYDDRNLYVGVRAYDSQPERIARGLGRRDNPPASDLVTVVVDPGPTRRTGYAFAVNAGGTLKDTLYYDDNQTNPNWDAVWDARAEVLEDGWSAELVVPLDVLRFSAQAAEQVWGLHVRRELRRTTEKLDSALMPVNANGFVSRFAPLRGLTSLTPPRTLQLLPYLAGRSVLSPRSSDAAGRLPRLTLASADVGVDLRAGLSSDMSLTATVNPDFGQVEADQVLINLGNSEVFFPEKRPFFNQGLDLFAPVRVHFGDGPHRLFYSRRIGLDTPVLGAAKLVGTVADGLEVGVLEAVVAGAANPSSVGPTPEPVEPELDTRVQFHPLRPFHLGPNAGLPDAQPFTRNFLAAAARQRVLGTGSVGLGLTDVTPLSRRCERDDFGVGPAFDEGAWAGAGCEAPGSTAAALDFNLRSEDGEWGVRGQLTGSRRKGDVPALTLLDGTVLRSGDLGWGTFVNAGKFGGEPFQAFVYYEHSSPTLDLNGVGFNGEQNLQALVLDGRWVRSEPLGPFRNTRVGLYGVRAWSADGKGLPRGTDIGLYAGSQLPDAVGVGLDVKYEAGGFDPRDIRYEGIPYEKAGSLMLAMGMDTDQSRPFSAGFSLGGYRNLPRGEELVALGGFFSNVRTVWRPVPFVETSLSGSFERMAFTARYLEGGTDAPLLFAALEMPQLSVTLRQQVVLSPTLTLQGYAQLFGATGTYGPYYRTGARAAGSPVLMTELERLSPDELAQLAPGGRSDDFEFAQLNLNVVLRWEYRLGSTLYAVYSRSQGNNPEAPLSRSLLPPSLRSGPASDSFMLKWTYLWDARV